ncbi:VanZ family protein [Paenibacillus yanchengensis]|uniref:VanZ family protein n=1 Tax=Paenibacillus yanchengensis TaxID=2035833 RepID=A0ABW4YLV5_9BACL
MSSYLQPILTAALFFFVLAIILIIPWLIYTYRKFGFLSISTTIIIFSFLFYFMAAFFLTMLPLPATRDNCGIGGASATIPYSLVPFQFIKDTLKNSGIVLSQPTTYIYAIQQPAFQQAFFNFLLLLPFGIYLRYFFQQKKYWLRALLIVFSTTLFYEITQATAFYGYYACPYRIFDVDDLMLNTAGGIFGFFAAPVVLAFFPSRAKVADKAKQIFVQDSVKPMAILLALFIDSIILKFLDTSLRAIIPTDTIFSLILYSMLFFALVFITPIVFNGYTIGSAILRFRYTSRTNKRSTDIIRLFKRSLALYALYIGPTILSLLSNLHIPEDSIYFALSIWLDIGIAATYFFGSLVLIGHVIFVLIGRGRHRFFFDEAADLFPTRLKKTDE